MPAGEISITFNVAKADEERTRDVLHREGFLVRSTEIDEGVAVAAERYVGVSVPDADVQRAHHAVAQGLLDDEGLKYRISGTGVKVSGDSKRLWSVAALSEIPPPEEARRQIRVEGAFKPVFRGSCFALRHSNAFLTAAHCVEGVQPEDIVVESPRSEQIYWVERIERHPSADLAFVRLRDDIWPEGIAPVPPTLPDPGWGEDFVAFGFPEDVFGEDAMRPTARIFKGHIQRLYEYIGPSSYRYTAAELSIGCPAGLSGGPLFPPQPGVLGLVTENRQSYTAVGREEGVISEEGGRVTRIERDVIQYGVAVVLADVSGLDQRPVA